MRAIGDALGAAGEVVIAAGNHDHAIEMIKMQGGVFGAVSNSGALIETIA